MKKIWCGAALLGAALLLTASVATAQSSGDEEDYYLDEEIKYEEPRFALGLGFGLVELGENVVVQPTNLILDDDVEQYYTINLRIRFGDRHANQAPASGGFRGYLEPELGYWSSEGRVSDLAGNDVLVTTDDLLLGVNVIGGMPVGAVEFFVGGGLGIHFVSSDIQALDGEAFGVNAQFGAEVYFSKRAAVFAVGRFDLVDDDRDELEGKAYVGARFRFGGDRS